MPAALWFAIIKNGIFFGKPLLGQRRANRRNGRVCAVNAMLLGKGIGMEIKMYHTLPEEAMAIRKTVFVEEQGFHDEFDEVDISASHLVLFDGGRPIATCRFFKNPGTNDYTVGRIAVLGPYRGQSNGAKLLREVERIVKQRKGDAVRLHAQVRAKGFYEKQGYRPYGAIELEEGCPHIWMHKTVGEAASLAE